MLLPWSILSSSSSTFDATQTSTSRKKRRLRARQKRLRVEELENRVVPATYHVDVLNPNAGTGTLLNPFKNIQDAVKAANTNPGADDIFVYGNSSLDPQKVYVWTRDGDVNGDGLRDGNLLIASNDSITFRAQTLLQGPSGTPAPLIMKLANNVIDIAGQMRVEGQDAKNTVTFTSFQDDSAGGDTNGDGSISQPSRLDWGGIRYRSTAVSQGAGPSAGSFVNFADIRYTGQTLFDEVAAADTEFAAIRMEGDTFANNAVKVRVWNTTFEHGSKALDVSFRSLAGTGPDIGNTIADPNSGSGATGPGTRISANPVTFVDNSINGLFVNIPFVPVVTPFSVTSEWDDVGVPYVFTQRLIVTQTLSIDPGMIVKSRREQFDTTTVSSAKLIVTGTENQPVLFTAVTDDDPGSLLAPYYANGSADTNNDGSQTTPVPGDWGGIQVNNGFIDHAIFRYGGGQVPFNGSFENRAPLNVLTFDLRQFGGPLENFQVSNTEITQTLFGIPAMEVLGDGIVSVTDNFIHDNPGSIAILAGSTIGTPANPDPLGGPYSGPVADAAMNYTRIVNPLGGYGVYYHRNIIENNSNNGVYAEIVTGDGYFDDTDVVQTVGSLLRVVGANQVRQLMSQRTVSPSINTGYLDRFQQAGAPGSNTQFGNFVSQIQGQGALLGPNPTNGDNDLFYYQINFRSTARGLTIPGVTATAPGDIRGEEWRDWGVDFTTPTATDLFPFKVFDLQPAPVDPNVLTTSAANDDGSMEMDFSDLVTAVGFWVTGNVTTSANEKIEYYGDQNQLLETVPLPTTGAGPVFIGRISKAPIYRVVIKEDANDGDQLGIDGLYFINAGQSLVVKMGGGADITAGNIAVGNPNSPGNLNGSAFDGRDVLGNGNLSVGPTLRILGQPDNPVKITAIADDDAGAGVFGHIQKDTNGDGNGSLPGPGAWVGIRLLPGVNSNRSEILTQLTNGTLLRQPSDLNPYTIGDEPNSIPDRLTRLVDGRTPATQNVQDGTLVEHSDIRFAAIGVDNQGFPQGKLSLENNSIEGNGNNVDDTTATAQILQPINRTDAGAVRLGAHSFFNSITPATFDVDVYKLTNVNGAGPNDNPLGIFPNPNLGYLPIYMDVDHTRDANGNNADGANNGQFDVWAFNAFDQLVYVNSRDLGGTANYMGPMHEIQGDVTANFANDPAADWDAQYVVVTPRGVVPRVLINDQITNGGVQGQLPNGDTFQLLPIPNGEGFRILFFDSSGNILDTITGSGFMTDPGFNSAQIRNPINVSVQQNYELEIRMPNLVTINGNQVDVHAGRQNDAIRNLDGQIIIRQNLIHDFLTDGVYLHDHWYDSTIDFNSSVEQDVVTQSGRYWYPNLEPNISPTGVFSNPNDYLPGVQVYNNVIANGGGNGVQLTEHDFLNVNGNVFPAPTDYAQILNNTIHNNNGNGVDLVTRGGPNVLNNIFTRQSTGVTIRDLGFAGATTVVNYNLFYQNAQNVAGPANGGNNLFNVDPQYVDVSKQDLRIFASSPAVDAGLSNLSDRLFALREPDEPTWSPTDDFRGKARIDNPTHANVGSGQFPFFDIGALEANESPLRVIALRPFFTSTVVPGPVPFFEVDFVGRVDPSTVVVVDNPATSTIDERTVKVTQGTIVRAITAVSHSYDPVRNVDTYRFTFDQPLADGTYNVYLDGTSTSASPGGIRDIAGQLLDGEFPPPATAPVFSFPSGNNVPAGDFNYGFTVVTSSVGDLVWNDLNGDGIKQSGEPVLANVLVTLLGAGADGLFGTGDDVVYPSQATNSAGSYTFSLLTPGVYQVGVVQSSLPANFVNTNPPVPRTVTLGIDEHRTDVDFGFWKDLNNASIGDLVWNDLNGDGVREPGEPGIGGVRVDMIGSGPDRVLGTPDDVVFAPRFTGSDGAYSFQNLSAWVYQVTVDLSSPNLLGFALTTGNQPFTISLIPGQTIGNADFGYQQANAIVNGVVFNDLNLNGAQDGAESGFINARVFIDANNNGIFDAGERFTNTGGLGEWNIGALASGTYTIRVDRSTLPGGLPWIPTTTYPQVVTLAAGQNLTGINFGFVQDPGNAIVSGRVFNDVAADGSFNGSDTGFSGINVLLTWAGIDDVLGNSDDVAYGPFTTNAAGQFTSLNNLPSGKYRALVQNPPTPDWVITTAGGNPSFFTLAPSQNLATVNFGFQLRQAQIGDLIFNDVNGNGVFDPAVGNPEAGINGVRINLLWAGPDGDFNTSGDNVLFPTKTTAGGGLFNFTKLAIGNYQLTVDTSSPVLTGYQPTTANPLFITIVSANQVITSADFGFQLRTSSIGDTVFDDRNADGVQGGAEFGIPNVLVWLDTDNNGSLNGNEQSVITDKNGIYHFNNLAPGTYNVRIDVSTLPPGSTLTNPADGHRTVNLGQGQAFADADFGVQLPASVTAGIFYFTLSPGGTLSNSDGTHVDVSSSDIVKLIIQPNGTKTFSIYFRGSDVGLTGGTESIDAFTFLPNGDIVLSLAGTGSVRQTYATPGNGSGNSISAFGEDLLQFQPTQINGPTAGTWKMYFDGSTKGLSGSSENVDAVGVLSDGRIVLSTAGNMAAGGINASSQDLVTYNPAKNKWSTFFKGSRVGLSTSAENVDGLYIPDTTLKLPTLVLSTSGNFTVTGVSGGKEDSVEFDPTSLEKIPNSGSVTKGSFNKSLAFDGSAFGLSGFNVTGMFLTAAPGPNPMVTVGAKAATPAFERLARWSEADGVVNVFVDASTFTTAEVARIHDAITNLNVTWQATSGLRMVEVTDPTAADVRIRGAASTAIGGKKQGVLGATQPSYDVGITGWLADGSPVATFLDHDMGGRTTITLVNSWNWYAGADASKIAAKQYDFESVVAHELGHAIGLVDNATDRSAVMSDVIKPGQTRRMFDAADAASIDALYDMLLDHGTTRPSDGTGTSTPSTADGLALLLSATGSKVAQPVVQPKATVRAAPNDAAPIRTLDNLAVDNLFAAASKSTVRVSSTSNTANGIDQPWWNSLNG